MTGRRESVMKRAFAVVSSLMFAVLVGGGAQAYAGEGPVASARVVGEAVSALPLVDRFEDEGQTLEILAPTAPYSAGAAVTLVYRNEDSHVLRTTVRPGSLVSSDADACDSFLHKMDPAFLSFVRASIADRMIRVRTLATELDRVEAALFFPSKRAELVRNRIGAKPTSLQETEYIPLAVD
jgi:hypothetical protein